MTMVRDERHMSEADRRELAYEARGDGVELDEEAVEPRRLDQMFSLRLDPDLAAALRDAANARGVSVSELLREAAIRLLEIEAGSPIVIGPFRVTGARSPATAVRSATGGIRITQESEPEVFTS
jgi:hypothetical protein